MKCQWGDACRQSAVNTATGSEGKNSRIRLYL